MVFNDLDTAKVRKQRHKMTGDTKAKPLLFARLQEKMGYHFQDVGMLQTALTHKSAPQAPHGHYERLEFLGDRVLGLAVSEALYRHFATEDQGYLTKRFHALVQQNALAQIADRLELSATIITDATKQAAQQPSVLSDVVEALIAAIYLDGGTKPAFDFVFRFVDITATSADDGDANPKAALQEWAMARGMALPSYQLIGTTGPDHAPEFCVEARLNDTASCQASGASKKVAEQQAARELLRIVKQKESS